MGASNVKWVRLGDYIEQCDERNSASINYPVIGINRDKTFMPTVANLDGVDIAKYKIVTKGMFVFSGMQTGRDICIRIGLSAYRYNISKYPCDMCQDPSRIWCLPSETNRDVPPVPSAEGCIC